MWPPFGDFLQFPKLFLLLSSSYGISSHESALSRPCSKKTTVQMVEMSLVPPEGNGFNCTERDSNKYLFGFKQVKSVQLNTLFLCKKELSQVQGCSYSGLFSLNTVQRCVRFRVTMSESIICQSHPPCCTNNK